jgi:hypothetical protein
MNTRLRIALVIVSGALVVVSLYLFVPGQSAVSINLGADVWVILTAVGTVAATVVAVWLAARALFDQKGAVARVVAAWVTDDYQPNAFSSSYLRTVVVHVANESNEPVYDAHVAVIVSLGVRLGPLSAPMPIAVVPPRRELQFDISLPLLAHGDTFDPRVELSFSDPRGRRWLRDSLGRLSEVTGEASSWREMNEDDPLVSAQMGLIHDFINPMSVAIRFLYLLRLKGDEFKPDEIAQEVLAPEAAGWAVADWDSIRADLTDYQPTSMVGYPAEYIARVKLVGDSSLQGKQVEGKSGIVLAHNLWLTLTFTPERGWRVWGLGNRVEPHQIQFPPGTFGAI